MAGLVDPEKLLSAMKSSSNYIYTYHAISRIMEDLPTVDIVRCKDCKWFRVNKTAVWCENERGLNNPQYDSFCSRGERREDAEKTD